ncbi:MAG: bifunctional (p)ppGpp synthetase/guanosine-3',5'-bis(diphosphate) 3'-pyrophosphohydrolase, partial [Ruminococcus sp.]|nr:bifunctional (p)ppGpp synthetase/guanosine-3',5'-bis(diphosphate) 3'-pyrophosphohydrolase [Candidatus Copronaster equi]
AILFATQAHSGTYRKVDKTPYVMHPIEVATIISSITNNEDVIIAGLLHDTVEDTDATINGIKEKFGDYVAQLVKSETEDKRPDQPSFETWKIRKEETLKGLEESKDINIKILWLSDKLANVRSLYRNYVKIGDKVFDSFNQKDKDEHKWYYYTILENISELNNTVAYMEFEFLVKKIFE